ncbi:hypothetical protein M9H77_14476 [Catharanthus roseus]|uniref:Uncharacterized protein n=1 Tax=Catharanthus roseus TaxID=4058 RepID=A0ACC0BNF4_CATRO|nr:hypothetical protein M9H77_14476 [Catharanthus roseus]
MRKPSNATAHDGRGGGEDGGYVGGSGTNEAWVHEHTPPTLKIDSFELGSLQYKKSHNPKPCFPQYYEHRSGLIWSGEHETCFTELQCRRFGRNLFQSYSAAPCSSAIYDYAQFGAFLDMGSGSPIDDLVESGTIRLLDWNDSMTDIQLGMRFVDEMQAISAVQKWSISVGSEYRVVKSKGDQWIEKFYYQSDSNYYSWSISHLVANDPEIPVSNVIDEVQVLFQIGCTYKRARENGTRADTYVPEIYLRQTYKRTYQSNFNSVLSENFWRDVPYNLTVYPPNMNKERGRKQDTQFQGEMDYRNPDSLPRCGRCRMPRHNRKNCNNLSSRNV